MKLKYFLLFLYESKCFLKSIFYWSLNLNKLAIFDLKFLNLF